jgi:formylglycine-generating enzyme required for sulfatase activity
MEFVPVPAGTFTLGSPRTEAGRLENEGPQRTVRISRPFLLGRHEVTVAQWTAFTEASGHRSDAERDAGGGFGIDFATGKVRQDRTITWRAPGFPGFTPGPEHPVVLISWQDAEAFCRWLSEREGRRYRLPTEAEWEYAARAGTTTAWSSGADPASLRGRANVADASLRGAMPSARWAEPWDDGVPFLAPVGSFAPNAWGLHDMHGNVWEWCADWFAADAYVALPADAPAADPPGPEQGHFRSIRGGGWFNAAVQNRSAQRVYFDPAFRYCLLSGFRVLLESE